MTVPGRSEFRSTFGGLFLLAGLALWLMMHPTAFLVIGLAWIGAGAGRVVSIFADSAYDPKNWVAAAFETAIGMLLLAGRPFALLLETIGLS